MSSPGPGADPPGPTERVRVTGPPRHRPRGTRTSEVDTETRVGEVLVGSLIREQLRLAVRLLLLLAVSVGLLPLVFHLLPGLSEFRVLGLPLAWLVLGFLVYPWLLVLGWGYVRRAEANEADFADLMAEAER